MDQNEHEIIKKVLKGDNSAFEQIVINHQQMVYRICFRFMKDIDDAEDISQDIFITIYKKIDKFDFKSSLSTWIYTISVNTCLNKLRAQKRYKTELLDDSRCAFNSLDPTIIAQANEERMLVLSEIDKLNTKSKLIVKLRLLNDNSFVEIGKILNIPVSSARTSFMRSREHLKQILINLRKE